MKKKYSSQNKFFIPHNSNEAHDNIVCFDDNKADLKVKELDMLQNLLSKLINDL